MSTSWYLRASHISGISLNGETHGQLLVSMGLFYVIAPERKLIGNCEMQLFADGRCATLI